MTTEPIKTLHRSKTNCMLAGVCGGVGEYFNIDPTIIRVLFIVFTLFGGAGIITYILLWIIIPQEEAGVVKNPHAVTTLSTNRNTIGLIIAIFGVFLLMENLGLFNFQVFWPLLLILLGVGLLLRK